jgi:hypothetical protein
MSLTVEESIPQGLKPRLEMKAEAMATTEADSSAVLRNDNQKSKDRSRYFALLRMTSS